MKKARSSLALLLLVASSACLQGNPAQMNVCDLVDGNRSMSAVRVRGHMVATTHGSYLADPDCPAAVIAWEDGEGLTRTEGYEQFREARKEVMVLDGRDLRAMLVDVEGRFIVDSRLEPPMLRVSRVHSLTIVPLPNELLPPPG